MPKNTKKYRTLCDGARARWFPLMFFNWTEHAHRMPFIYQPSVAHGDQAELGRRRRRRR